MTTKIERARRKLNDEFRDALREGMAKKFDIEIQSEWVFLADRLVTTRTDGEPFTPEQHAYLAAFEAGYQAAAERVCE